MPLCLGLKWMTTFVSGRATGVALKLKTPNLSTQAESVGFVLETRRIFRVVFACGLILSHSLAGKWESHVHKPVMR